MQGYEPFDILHSPLDGTNLIEASAGTGKTYTLTALFIRLVVQKGLPVDRILTVTFTEAATNELKERVRGGLRGAMDAFSGKPVKDPFLHALALHTDRKERAGRLVGQALRDFDRAAVFTIHGFCMRVLSEHAFESGAPFDTGLLSDVRALQREVVQDFWRREVSAASPLFAMYALARGITPDALLSLTGIATGFLEPRIVPQALVPETAHEERSYFEAFDRAARVWPEARDEVSRILMEDKALKRNKYRPDSVEGLIRSMDAHMVPRRPDSLLFQGFEKFAASAVAEGTKSKHSPPEHPFFDLCESLLQCRDSLHQAFDQRILGLKVRLFTELDKGLRAGKSARNVRSFDDLLRDVLEALRGTRGALLAAGLRSRYGAALIDEFQDTDPVQYGIFNRLFGGGVCPLFLIGDPKQAIYRFRGADVFAYMEAAREADRRYTLPDNYRSEPGLIKAVNTFFVGHQNPFALEEIPYHPVEPAQGDREVPALRLNGRSEPPFRIWIARASDAGESQDKITKGAGRDLIPDTVASEAARLVTAGRSGEALIGETPLQEGDIAVLLRTNAEAAIMQQAMTRRGIASVLYTASSLFETGEAEEMGRILNAMAAPEQEGLLRAALATVALGSDGPGLEAISLDESLKEALLVRFRAYHEAWSERGFFQAFRELLRRESVLQRLLRLNDGERRATNLLHLSEVLHQAETERGFKMEGLIKWLLEQRDPLTRGTEEHPLRLESDRNVVKLVTIHKSKGLEYPVVFCPFMWEGAGVRDPKGPVSFHDRDDGARLTIDLGSPPEERELHISLAEQENLSENLRILYVAFTRARNLCYTIWGRFNKADTSAPAYLFHTRRPEPGKTPVQACASRFAELDASGMLEDLEALEEASNGSIDLASLPEGTLSLPPLRPEVLPSLSARSFTAGIDRSWGIASFSSLTSNRRHAMETPDYDFEPDPLPGADYEAAEHPPGEGRPAGLFGFPAGTRSGTCLHSILESLDFMDPDPSALSATIQAGLSNYGFDPAWEETVRRMFSDVVSTPLDPEHEGLRLDRVSTKDRLNELSFFFPLNRLTPALLQEALAPHAGRALPEPLPERIGRLSFSPVNGFMRGFVDLVFRFEDRWYIVDWKSNDLGPSMDDYSRERIESAMVDGLYSLQYLLYTLALDQYLSLRIKGYEYKSHFGGVYYVFLRGVDPAAGPGSGVFGTLPPEPLIRNLREALIPRLKAE